MNEAHLCEYLEKKVDNRDFGGFFYSFIDTPHLGYLSMKNILFVNAAFDLFRNVFKYTGDKETRC